MRIEEEAAAKKKALEDIKNLSDQELFLIGVALYWAEGTKKSGVRPGSMVDFANSDPRMILFFVEWLKKSCGVHERDIKIRLHLHIFHRDRETEIKEKWSKEIGLPVSSFTKTLYKKHNVKTVRYKTGKDYIGLVSIRVLKSTALNRRIIGWIHAIIATQK